MVVALSERFFMSFFVTFSSGVMVRVEKKIGNAMLTEGQP